MKKQVPWLLVCLVALVLTVAHRACSAPIHDAAAKGDVAKVKMLLDSDHSLVNALDSDGATPLHHATAAGSVEVVQLLLVKGSDVNAKKKDGVRPLHIAAALARKDALVMLITAGADVNAADDRGRTALFLSRECGDASLGKLLTDAGAKRVPAAERPADIPAATRNPLPMRMVNSSIALIPIRRVSDWLGGTLKRTKGTNQLAPGYTLAYGGHALTVRKDSQSAIVAGRPVKLPCAPREYENELYVPLRTIAETFGIKFNWFRVEYPHEGISLTHPTSGNTLAFQTLSDSTAEQPAEEPTFNNAQVLALYQKALGIQSRVSWSAAALSLARDKDWNMASIHYMHAAQIDSMSGSPTVMMIIDLNLRLKRDYQRVISQIKQLSRSRQTTIRNEANLALQTLP